MEREEPCTKGIAVMFNMNDFGMSNFATDYWFQLMTLLQGQKVPARVNLLLIVNAPDWFGTTIWKIMKPMLSADFAERVTMIHVSELSDHLADGFEQYLPNEMSSGQACTDEMVHDFCEYRKAVEAAQGHVYFSENNNNNNAAPRPTVSRSNSSRGRFDLSALQSSMMSATSADSSSAPAGRMGGIPRSISCISLASDYNKSISSNHNHNNSTNGMQRQSSCQSISMSGTAAAAAAVVDSPRKQQQQSQRGLPPQSPNKRNMLLSSPMRRQASCHSLSAESCEAMFSPRRRIPRQSSFGKLRSSPNRRAPQNLLALQDKLGMPTLDTSFTSIASDITDEAFM